MAPPIAAVLAQCLDEAELGLALFDAQDVLVYCNRWFRMAFHVAADGMTTWESMMRASHRDRRGVLISTDDIDAWIDRVRRRYRQQPTRRFESDLTDGRWLSVTETLLPDGWQMVAASDVTALKANEAAQRHAHDQALLASFTDPLTELYNRRFVMRRLADLLTVGRDMRCPLCVAALDLDHFKLINDRHGHSRGDDVLRHFAVSLRTHLRPLDIAGRIGGEEFLLLLPDTGAEGARLALARRSAVVASGRTDASAVPYSYSAGIALTLPDDTPLTPCSPAPTGRSTSPRPRAATASSNGPTPHRPARCRDRGA